MPRPQTKPYTSRGIVRVPCTRCGAPSFYQWQICALDRQYHAICAQCDIALNGLVLKFFGIPQRSELMKRYRDRVKADAG